MPANQEIDGLIKRLTETDRDRQATDKERETERLTETEVDRQTDRQREGERLTKTGRDRKTNGQREGERDSQGQTEIER